MLDCDYAKDLFSEFSMVSGLTETSLPHSLIRSRCWLLSREIRRSAITFNNALTKKRIVHVCVLFDHVFYFCVAQVQQSRFHIPSGASFLILKDAF